MVRMLNQSEGVGSWRSRLSRLVVGILAVCSGNERVSENGLGKEQHRRFHFLPSPLSSYLLLASVALILSLLLHRVEFILQVLPNIKLQPTAWELQNLQSLFAHPQ